MEAIEKEIQQKKKWHLLLLDVCKKYRLFTYIPIVFLSISSFSLRNKNEVLVKRVVRLETVNEALVSNMILYNRRFETFPMPVFQKLKRSNQFIAQYFNPAYVNLLGHNFEYNRYKYIGKTDYDYYPKRVADLYYNFDVSVAFTGFPMKIKVTIKDSSNTNLNVEVMKWRQIREEDTLIYGMIILEKLM
ncbi:hypothetical protein KORDIASMS9_04228 [Kordia sp. SMS9]|uniref:hypothetical protein n=1 Tax=Kordia sp. SMS9 TaxID=2282170 RepID=UPI000E0D6A1F|nr:hypothetical protein [Kordia sp. SMS9]AXG71970.1 hypothetical protein KORDIASMS9_04228 [Kordia sp. SMS9]